MALPDWRLPRGVTRGAWDYIQSRPIANRYDTFHAANPLFPFEEAVLREEFGVPRGERPGVIADFGCGSGRALTPLVRAGWQGLAIDLSPAMLDVVRTKASTEGLAIDCVEANLVELGPERVADAAADHGMCLFSTLGMITGRDNRRAALQNMGRVIRPGGKLVLHVHNFWFNLRDPGGPWWALGSYLAGGRGGYETGDRTYSYRGVPNFFLHVYRRHELAADLAAANLRPVRWIPLAAGHRGALRHAWWLPALRTQGWIVVADR
ncbi:class I SAM-dependent methyltransferase [Botrimarina hoheduenensis]|uniref:Bifunctional 3-demethylubiquinone-9 3-methyltransferase/ 2-octaprenyl-6-hydroxy phenol methylase n=1 Tax=Botrimarina hoheduenensis TaxID=2528000 RepID=A0A5C5WBK8_9BACT|nr:class I SAM-dependent methyltransferase [Botrimarina hoheduenensis]TWT47421.1 bifunctional 3-demethylubiquinone-9 3-methyltransferase/ 2-octaprenyl-6-hydroxy phenol methylase [Botrimarina hoheduenensis]